MEIKVKFSIEIFSSEILHQTFSPVSNRRFLIRLKKVHWGIEFLVDKKVYAKNYVLSVQVNLVPNGFIFHSVPSITII